MKREEIIKKYKKQVAELKRCEKRLKTGIVNSVTAEVIESINKEIEIISSFIKDLKK